MTISRILNDHDLKARRKVAKPRINTKYIKKRLGFAKKYEDWTVEDWKRVWFSDECYVIPKHSGVQFVRKRDDEDWIDERFISQKQQRPEGVIIWAVMNSKGILHKSVEKPELFTNLYASMPNRIQQLKISGGRWTKY